MLRLVKIVLFFIAPLILFMGTMYFILGKDVSFYQVAKDLSTLNLGKDEIKNIIEISNLWESLYKAVQAFSTPVFDFSSPIKAIASIGGLLVNIGIMLKSFIDVIIHGFESLVLLLLVSVRDIALILKTFFFMFI